MKVLLITLGLLNLIMYWHGLRNRKDVKKVLIKGAVEVEGEKLALSAIVFQARCFLVLVLAMNQCLWFLCFQTCLFLDWSYWSYLMLFRFCL